MTQSGVSKLWLGWFAALLLGISGVPSATAQEGLGERIGARIDRGIEELGDDFRESWASLQKTVDNLSVQGRVYSRLHWDKQLVDARIEVSVAERGVVSMRGSVGNSKAKAKAMKLAQDTVGVEKVINHLTVPVESASR